MIAAEQGHQQLVGQLLAAGAVPDRRDLAGKTAFDLAADTTAREPVDAALTGRLLGCRDRPPSAARSASGKVSTIPVMPGLLARSLVLNWCRVSSR